MTTPTRVLVDTSAVTDLGAREHEELGAAVPVVSAVTVAELAFRTGRRGPGRARRRTDRFYAVLRELPVLPFDLSAARVYGVPSRRRRDVSPSIDAPDGTSPCAPAGSTAPSARRGAH